MPSVHSSAGDTDIAAPREKIDPQPVVAFAFSPTVISRGVLRGRDVPERGHERAQLAMPLDAPEAFGGTEQAEPDPPSPHVPVAPALDIPRDVPQRPDEILDAVRRCEEAAERWGQPQL